MNKLQSTPSAPRVIAIGTVIVLMGPMATALVLYTGIAPHTIWPWLLLGQAALIVAGAVFINLWLRRSVFDPLRQLTEQVHHAAHSGIHPTIEPIRSSVLTPVSDAVVTISQELARSRRETHKAMALSATHAAQLSARLEAIIRDLADGLVLCNLSHRIVLFNDATQLLLGDDMSLGLGRSLTQLLKESQLHEALAELQRRKAADLDPRSTLEFACERSNPAAERLRCRMSLILTENGDCEGYVVTLSPLEKPADEKSEARVLSRSRVAPRPEFYDFSLFDPRSSSPLLEQPIKSLPLTVFDLETTGLKPSQGDAIVQIAGIRILNGRLVSGEVFDRMVNPGRAIPASATRIHGITDEMVSSHPPAEIVLADFFNFSQDSVLVAHNAAFDMKCLSVQESTTGIRFDHPILDTLLLSILLQPAQTDHSLDALCTRFEINNTDRHTAFGDARATAEILINMLPLLEGIGLSTLGEVITACSRIYDMRSLQSHF
ncbi:MAG: PAS domain-containing protein [Gammaproteobacteria bacterium]|nr:PAS domain-containing protein [Gammaproteobacteria bacterium]